MRVVFDLETDGLMDLPWEPREDGVTKIHCAVTHSERDGTLRWVFPDLKEMFLSYMEQADCLVGHNIVGYDLPVLKMLWDWEPDYKMVDLIDTRLVGEMAYSLDRLWKLQRQRGAPVLPKELVSRQSLEAWGLRIGEQKGTFGQSADWKVYSEEMLDYCEQDVKVNARLLDYFIAESGCSEESMKLESKFAHIMWEQRMNGVKLDTEGATALVDDLLTKREEIGTKLRERFPAWQERDGDVFIPKRDNKTRGYVKGVPIQKLKWVELKPSSRFHIHRCLSQLGWEPLEFNNDGSATVNRTILRELPYPEAHLFADYEEIQKKIAMVYEGPSAWLKLANRDGLLHGRVNTTGARTGRCTHSSPNLAQVPSEGAMRKLIGPVTDGWVQVGADASGLEFRCLAHYTTPFDDGQIRDLILDGDIHTTVQNAVGLKERNSAKTFSYALMYGAGDIKLGQIVADDAGKYVTDPKKLARAGSRGRARLMDKLKGLAKVSEGVKMRADTRGYMMNVDGRRVYDGSAHSALNSLLQGTGAIIMKQATVRLHDAIQGRVRARFMLNVHDEFQLECHPDDVEELKELAVEAIRQAGRDFKLNIPLDGEAKAGADWSECH